jgi:hypothetical protein
MRRCVVCGQFAFEVSMVGNVCEDCFRQMGDRICCICGREIIEGEETEEYWKAGHLDPNNVVMYGRVCSDCASNLVRCSDCGRLARPITPEMDIISHDIHYLREIGSGRTTDRVVCDRCVRHYRQCYHCSGSVNIWTERYSEDSRGHILCGICQSLYGICSECGEFVSLDRAIVHEEGGLLYYYCENCANGGYYDGDESLFEDEEYEEESEEESEVINRYSFKPFPKFHCFLTEKKEGEPPLFLGVELEIDDGGEDHYFAELILREGYPGFLYAKRDGSLRNGFEIVSHPATLAFHLIEAGWERVLKKANDLGYTSHDNKRCGLHIHINRTFWGPDDEDKEIGELKLLIFFERFWNEIVRFSRRTQSQIDRYCSRYGTDNLETAKRWNGDSRYFALNFQNRYTIEIRIFRGTLKLDTFFATLEFVHYLCYYLKQKTPHELQKTTWGSFIKGIPEWMVELKSYLKRRGLAP